MTIAENYLHTVLGNLPKPSSPYLLRHRTTFYTALGLRKMKLSTWNPFRIFRGLREVSKRMKRKGISGNMKGEGLVQGGIIIFDRNGKARYAYREETGFEVPVDDIIAAVKMVKTENAQS